MGWFLKGSLDRVNELEDKYNTWHEYYVKQTDFKDFKTELWKRLDELKSEIRKTA